MKKSVSVFLLVIFLFNVAGMFGLISFLKQKNYENVFCSDAHELKLVRLTIPKTETIHWEKENEIVYKGKYYDVFSKSEDISNYFLVCYLDSKDNSLSDAFGKHISKQQSESTTGKSSNTSVQIITQDYLAATLLWMISISSVAKTTAQFSFSTSPGYYSVFSPPPELS